MEVNDEKLIDVAMYNAYYVLTGKKKEKELIEKNLGTFLYNPINGKKSIYTVIDDVIDYMEGLEEYEKCQELIDIKKNLLINIEHSKKTKV